MAVSRKRNLTKGLKLFGRTVPKAKVERGVDEQGKPFIRFVDHVLTANGRDHVYSPHKGWSRVRNYMPHLLLNSIWTKAGFPSLYN